MVKTIIIYFKNIDEVSSLVFDLGTFNNRIGYSGEDSPTCVFQPVVGIRDIEGKSEKREYFYSETDIRYFKEDMHLMRYMNDKGFIENYDLFEKTLDNLLKETLHIDLKDHPILFAEPSEHNKEQRKKITEFMFEKYNIPAMFICKSAVLSAFSCGRSNCLVFDSGHSQTYSVPVIDGYVLQKTFLKNNIAGDYITKLVKSNLDSKGVEIYPFFRIKKKRSAGKFTTEYLKDLKCDPKMEEFWKDEIYRDIKENCLIANDDIIPYNSEKDSFSPNSMASQIKYELPDGNSFELLEDRMYIIERVFNPIKGIEKFGGYHKMIIESIKNSADVAILKDLYSNIFICGGNTLFTNFPEKLQKLISNSMTDNCKVKTVTHPSSTEKKFSSWIGGSVLSSLGTFHQLWLSKQEVEEHGASIIERKCA